MPLWDWDPTGKFKAEDAYLLTYDQSGQIHRRPLAPTDKRGPTGNEKTGPLDSQIFADSAVNFIKTEARAKPFFMYLAFHCPHDPRQAPEKYKQMYPEDQIPLPPSYLAQHPFDNGAMVIRDEELAPWPRTPAVIRLHLSDYYAAISFLDAQLGRVIQALKDNGTYDNMCAPLMRTRTTRRSRRARASPNYSTSGTTRGKPPTCPSDPISRKRCG